MNKRYLPLITALLSSTIFAFAFFFTVRAQGAVGNDTFKMLTFRMWVAVLSMTALWRAGVFKMSFKGKDIRPLLLCGLLVPVISFTSEFYALARGWATTGQVAMFYALSPVASTIMGILFLREKPVGRQYVFMAISVLGLVIINWGVSFETSHPLGLLLPALAVLCYCFNVTLLRKTAGQFTPTEMVYITSSVGMVVFTCISLGNHLFTGALGSFFDGVFTWTFAVSIFYLAVISSIFGFTMSNYTVSKLPPVVSSSFSGFSTILAIVNGVLLLDETIRAQDVAGCALILTGALLMNASHREPPVSPDDNPEAGEWPQPDAEIS